MDQRQLKRTIWYLRKKREYLARQLDKALTGQSTSDYLALEERYQRISLLLDKLLPKLNASG